MTKKQQIEFLKRRNDYLEQELDRTKRELQKTLTDVLNINALTETALDYLFEDTLPFSVANIFKITSEHPLTKLPTFEEWFETLTREDLNLGASDSKNKALIKFLENCTLAQLKAMLRHTAKRYYERELDNYFERCERIIKAQLEKELRNVKGEE